MKKIYTIIGTIAVLTSIPMALGAIGNTAEKVKTQRDNTLDGIHNLAQDACQWQTEYIKLRIKEEDNPDNMIELANHLKRVQNDCIGWVSEQVFTTTEKS
jgi:hypothetical protein